MRTILRILWPGLLLGLALTALLWLLWFSFLAAGTARGSEVVTINPDPRVVWEPEPVGGMFLVRPDGTDVIAIPAGAVLMLPRSGRPAEVPDGSL